MGTWESRREVEREKLGVDLEIGAKVRVLWDWIGEVWVFWFTIFFFVFILFLKIGFFKKNLLRLIK